MEDVKNHIDVVSKLLTSRDDESAREYLSTLHPSDNARVFEEIIEEDMAFPRVI